MERSSSIRWYAIEVRIQHESQVARALSERGYEQFVPMFNARAMFKGASTEVKRPLFPGYVFGRLDIRRRLPILVIPGVRQIVGAGRTPIPIEDGEIKALQAILETGLAARPWPYPRTGQRVRLDYGEMKSVDGVLLEANEKHRLIVSVSLLERSVAVEVDEAWVTPVESRSQGQRQEAIQPQNPSRRQGDARRDPS